MIMPTPTRHCLHAVLLLSLITSAPGCAPAPEPESEPSTPSVESAPLALTRCGVIGLGLPTAVAYSPDGATLAAGSTAGVIKLYRASDGTELRTLLGHSAGIAALVFSPDGRWLAS